MKTAAIIQARMGSTRYPGKVLDEIAGVPMLHHIVERTRYAGHVDAIVIATTTNADDRILLKRAREWQVIGFAGPERDVLKRYLAAANLVEATVVIRLTGDNPLFEPRFIDACAEALRREDADYSYVDGCILGTGVEVITVEALKKEDALATLPHQREHVTPYIMEHPDKFKIVAVQAEPRYRMPEGVRLTVDTKEDIKLVRRIYRRLYHGERVVSLARTVELLKKNPKWVGLNKDVFQKPPTSSEVEEAEVVVEEPPEEEEAAVEVEVAEEPAEPEPPPISLRVEPPKPRENDKLDELMAKALTKEEEEAKRKEAAPQLQDVLDKAQQEAAQAKPVDTRALDKLFRPEPPAEEAAAEEAPAESAEPAEPEEPEEPEKPEEPDAP